MLPVTSSATISGVEFGLSSLSRDSRTFTIAKANQTITFPAVGTVTYGDADAPLGATASSGLAVSYSASVSTPEMIAKTTEMLALSYNLGTEGGARRTKT